MAITYADEYVPLGYLFSTLMVAVMIGSLMFRVLTEQSNKTDAVTLSKGAVLAMTLATAAASFWTMTLWANNVRHQMQRINRITD